MVYHLFLYLSQVQCHSTTKLTDLLESTNCFYFAYFLRILFVIIMCAAGPADGLDLDVLEFMGGLSVPNRFMYRRRKTNNGAFQI